MDLIPVTEVQVMAQAVARSGLFGVKSLDQALSLMLIAQAEGRHPALAARDYDVIQGRPAKKAEAMLRDFFAAGGRVEWHELSDTVADATFSHEQGGKFRCHWDMARAKKAGLGGKDMWSKYPRQMLRSRCVSEGVRTVWPTATSGMYVPEEVQDFAPSRGRQVRDITPPSDEPAAPMLSAPITPSTGSWDHIERDRADEIVRLTDEIRAHYEAGDIAKACDAWKAIEWHDEGEQIAAWTCFDSKMRRAMKDYGKTQAGPAPEAAEAASA